MRLTVADAISPSYFVAIAAVQLGFFRQEGVDMEFVFAPPNPSQALKDGTIDFFGGSPYTGLRTFRGWRGGVLLCALSHYTYWFLAVRSDIKCERGRQCGERVAPECVGRPRPDDEAVVRGSGHRPPEG
jgi:NitT/TauT family transport system substrate-binding protein